MGVQILTELLLRSLTKSLDINTQTRLSGSSTSQNTQQWRWWRHLMDSLA